MSFDYFSQRRMQYILEKLKTIFDTKADSSDIPTVGNGTLTIKRNGTKVNDFTANSSSDVTADISVPTKVSDLTNDSGFVASSDLGTAAYKDVPTSGNASTSQVVMGDDTRLSDSRSASDVYSWAKAENKPSYTASEVGLGNVPNVSTNDQTPTYTEADTRANLSSGEKLSVAFGKIKKYFTDLKTVAFTGSYTDLTDQPTIPTIPGVVSTSANGLAPKITDTSKYLKGDGTWSSPPDTNNRRSFYGTCSTAADTAAKVVALVNSDGWELVEGVVVTVKFSNTNTASNCTLNINGTGAKSIYYNNAVYTGASAVSGYANRYTTYMYDGTYWVWISQSIDSNDDTKVTQSNTNTTNWRKVVLGHQDNASPGTATTTTTNQVYVNPSIEVQSSSGRIRFKAHNELITGSGTAGEDKGEGVSPRYFPAKWTFNLGVVPMDGDNITIKIPVAGHNYGVYVSINNGTNYHPVVLNGTGRLTTHFPNATYVTLVFETGGSAANIMPLNGGDATTTVSGGVWRVINYYDSNSNVTQTATNTNANYEVLFSATADNTTRTEGARKYSNLKFNPSTGNLQATQLNGVTIGNSPKFTDNNTTYTFAQGDNAGTIKVTPSGGSASNISVKPFDLSIAADSGTSALTMAASTKYKLTAGGSSFIFTSTPNTWRGIQNNLTSDETAQSLSAAQGKALANGSARDSTKLPLAGGTMTGKITSAKANNFYATGSGTAAQDKGEGVSPRYFPAKWTFNTGANASNGDTIIIKVPVAGHSYGVFVSINNGTNYYPVAVNYSTSRLQTHYPNGAIIQLVFDSSGTVNDVFALNGGDARTNVSGGCWRVLNWYDTNTDIRAQSYCDTAAATAAKVASCTNYNLLSKSYILVTMVYANSSASALTLNVNGKGAKPIYINGSASSASNYTLPAGTYLVYYNGTNYYFRTDGKITASITGDAATVNGKTVGVNVPSDAVFTDHYAWSDITGKPSSYTPASHTHGNIQNGGTLQTNDITIASGDKLVVTDSSDSAKVARTSISFDGSTATKCLTQKGTWESFPSNNTRRCFYCTCETAAATANKVVTLNTTSASGWELVPGTIIGVKFTNTNTATSVTLSVNSTSAKSIRYNGDVYTGSSGNVAGISSHVIYYMYDGSTWSWLGIDYIIDTTYSVVSSSANGLAPKVTDTSKFLKGDGTWSTPTNTTYFTGISTSTVSNVTYGWKYLAINGSEGYYNRAFDEYMQKTTTLSTTADTTVTFSSYNSSASSGQYKMIIEDNSGVDVYTNIYGVNPKSVSVSSGTCTIVFGPYTSAASLTVRIYIRNISSTAW